MTTEIRELQIRVAAQEAQLQVLSAEFRFVQKQLSTLGTPWWRRLWFRIDGWPPWWVVADAPKWRPWRRWWRS